MKLVSLVFSITGRAGRPRAPAALYAFENFTLSQFPDGFVQDKVLIGFTDLPPAVHTREGLEELLTEYEDTSFVKHMISN